MELGRPIADVKVVLNERYGGHKYGLANEGRMEVVRMRGCTETMLLDAAYQGKCAAGNSDPVRKGNFPKARSIFTRTCAACRR